MASNRKFFLFNIGLAIFTACIISFLSSKGLLERIELASLDFSFRLRGPIQENPRINIIEITDADIGKIGRWPWERNWHAAITSALTELGAKYIYFDIIFSESSEENEDLLFQKAIKNSKNVYLPFVFQDTTIDINNALLPIKEYSEYIKGTGAVNIYPDADGTLRRIPIVFTDTKGNIYPHAALQIALDYNGLKIQGAKDKFVILAGNNKEIKIPVSGNNQMLINWAGRWENTFKHYDFLDVLAAYKDILDNKKPKINVADLKDSICIIGLTAIGLYDIKPIPLQPEYPGIGIVANTVNNILNKNFIFELPSWLNLIAIFLLSLLPAFFILGKKPLREATILLLIGLTYFFINFILFQNHMRLDLSSPLIAMSVSSLAIGTYNFVRVSVERQNFFKMSVTDGLTGLYNIRYFKMLLETELAMARVDREKKFAIIMSDVDHFKHFNDTYGHQVGDLVLKEVSGVLKNSVRSSDIVARYGGEEMIILLRGSSTIDDATNVAEKIKRSVENTTVNDQNNSHKVTISLGVSFIIPGDSIDSIIKRADDGLYKAKTLGRNRVCAMKEDLKSIPPK